MARVLLEGNNISTVMNVKFLWHFSMQEVSSHSVTAGSTVAWRFDIL